MKTKVLSIFVGILLLVGTFASPRLVRAWTVSPQKVTFLNDQGITLTGWVFKPSTTGPHPAVVMLHGCAGVFSYSDPTRGIATQYREWGDRLVNAGYVALLVDSFTPRNAPQNECGLARASVSEVNTRPHDAYAGLKFIASKSYVYPGRIGLLGWSHGGSSAMVAMDVSKFNATSHFKAAVEFYPGCGLYNAFGGLTTSTWKPYAPSTILIGSADTVVSPSYCQTRVSRAQKLGSTYAKITIFTNAHHGFDLARKVEGNFTQYDVNAKIAADAQAMQIFAVYLPK